MLYCSQDPEREKFEIKILPSVGCSVFTKVPFQKGSRVCRYNGELISKKEMEKREKIYDSDPKFYWSFVLDFSCGAKHLAIDATFVKCVGWLINHSIANANIVPVRTQIFGDIAIVFVALRDIAVGEELLYKYGEKQEEIIEHNIWLSK